MNNKGIKISNPTINPPRKINFETVKFSVVTPNTAPPPHKADKWTN